MTTEAKSLNVRLPSIGSRNVWFLIARLIETLLNTDKLQRMIRVSQTPES